MCVYASFDIDFVQTQKMAAILFNDRWPDVNLLVLSALSTILYYYYADQAI